MIEITDDGRRIIKEAVDITIRCKDEAGDIEKIVFVCPRDVELETRLIDDTFFKLVDGGKVEITNTGETQIVFSSQKKIEWEK